MSRRYRPKGFTFATALNDAMGPMTQKELSDAIALDDGAVSRILNGKCFPSWVTLHKMMKVLPRLHGLLLEIK